jgi:glycosidase
MMPCRLRIVFPLLLLLSLPAQAQDLYRVTFAFRTETAVQSVSVAGTFNQWNVTANPLTPDTERRVWSLSLRLPPGEYQYKFVVDGNRWLTDPAAHTVDDGHGNRNSLLMVLPRGYDRPARAGDGKITGSAVYHQPGARYLVRSRPDQAILTLRSRRGDVDQAFVARPGVAAVPMQRAFEDSLFTYWRAAIATPSSGILRYAFKFRDGKRYRLYDNRKWLRESGARPDWFRLNLADVAVFETPDWARDAVFYQIFPERFANGDPANDPKEVEPWGSPPTYFNRMGGDLKGIGDRLDYLQSLGINALYLNPIFHARSNHRYDTTDYLKIEPEIGTNEEFRALMEALRRRSMRIILDAVFNHTGVDFAGFKDLQKNGANSAYVSWYFVRGYPIEVKDNPNYVGWYGSPWMPKLNVLNPATRDYLLDVATRWIREYNIDGWRLDVGDEVDSAFWRLFRQRVRAAKPDAYIVGETWRDAQAWLQGDQWDAAMNYPWRGAVLDFFAFETIPPVQFDRRLTRIRADYPPQAYAVMFNMLSSHDTERILTLCKGDVSRVRRAALFQMTYPGAPCVYYGDEIGMEGGRDPDNRRAMIWDTAKQNADLLAFHRLIIGLRRDHAVLRGGDFQTLIADDSRRLFAFARRLEKAEARVYFNQSSLPQTVAIPQEMALRAATEPIEESARSGGVFRLPPKTGALFIKP